MKPIKLSNLSLLHVQRLMTIDTVAVIIEKQKIEFYLKQTKIILCSVVGYYRFLLFDLSRKLIECSVNWFYSLIIINYGTTYNVSFWYHTTKYINVLNYALQFRPGTVYALICKNHSKIDQVYKPLKNKQLN